MLFRSEDQRLSFAQFNRRVNRLANALRDMGLRKGDKLATILPNCLELLEIYWAVAKIGVVVVPLSPLLRGQGLVRLLNDSDAVAVITNQDFSRILDPLRIELPYIRPQRYLLTDGRDVRGFHYYHDLNGRASDQEPPRTEIGRAHV